MTLPNVDPQTELRLISRQDSAELFKLFEDNREHLRRWHPWVDHLRSAEAVERAIASWQQLYAQKRACHAGIWFQGQFCGMVSYLNVDSANRWTPLCYWLDAAHQGRGIMTACCRAMVAHGFALWKLNRITIECATENTRSRAVAERLGFKLEGVVREVQWLHDRFVDAALYGLLRSDCENHFPGRVPACAITGRRGTLPSRITSPSPSEAPCWQEVAVDADAAQLRT